ncbi:transposon-encoded TnpW family protein [Ruthenibacterium lactatiformans]|uniref:transposon-encoded TnpW family protein n=1 Tax=Ruthenibacterium lactatiformans TaxID=1550024 RepID=UPI003AB97F4C
MSEETCTKQTVDTATARSPEDIPALVKTIGKTTYKVRVHFSQTSNETMSDKIKRMLKNEIQQM